MLLKYKNPDKIKKQGTQIVVSLSDKKFTTPHPQVLAEASMSMLVLL